MLAVIFLMSGAMKLFVPMLAEAWSGQLLAAELPFYTLSRWSVPFVEMALGALLLVGWHTRLAVLVMEGIMIVAIYVHGVVDDPSLFPLQPQGPIIPVVIMVLGIYLLRSGAGAWSVDGRALQPSPD